MDSVNIVYAIEEAKMMVLAHETQSEDRIAEIASSLANVPNELVKFVMNGRPAYGT